MTDAPPHPDQPEKSLPRRAVGRSRLAMTNLTFGTWGLAESAYGTSSAETLATMVDAAIAEGIRAFDVAPLWGDGLAETVVGERIRAIRSDVVVISRAGAVRKGANVVRAFDGPSIEGSLEASVRRLGTHVDALLLHDPPEKILATGSFAKAMAGLQARGDLAIWGVSTSSPDGARIALGMGAKLVALPYNLFMPDVLHAVMADAIAYGASVLVTSPLAHGVLTERGVDRGGYPEDDHRSRRWDDATLGVRRKQAGSLGAVWVQKTRTLTEFALRYALTPEVVASAAIGPRTVEDLRELTEAVRNVDRLPGEVAEKTVQVAAALGI